MNKEQAISILTQGINLAVGAGAFKIAKDVALVTAALEVVTQELGVVLQPLAPDNDSDKEQEDTSPDEIEGTK